MAAPDSSKDASENKYYDGELPPEAFQTLVRPKFKKDDSLLPAPPPTTQFHRTDLGDIEEDD